MPNTTAVRTAQVGAAPLFAGKNKIINGDFGVWQRGTSFNPGSGAYTADRFIAVQQGTGTPATSQQTFTPGTGPVSGYESTYFLRMANASGTTYCELSQKIEDVRMFAGQTVTFSFWGKATSSITMQPLARQSFGTGGSTQVDTNGSTVVLTSSWARYSITMTLPSITGKTIGTSSSLSLFLYSTAGTVASNTVDTWGWQLEAGSTATAFQTATGTIQGELAACQRYYFRVKGDGVSLYGNYSTYGVAQSTTIAQPVIVCPVPLRGQATSMDYSAITLYDGNNFASFSSIVLGQCNANYIVITATGTGYTQYRPYTLIGNGNANAYIGVSAEL